MGPRVHGPRLQPWQESAEGEVSSGLDRDGLACKPLPPGSAPENIRELYVFDLDDTLVRSPDPGEAIQRWEAAKGCKLPNGTRRMGSSWFDRPESFDASVGIERGPVFDLWEICAGKKSAMCIILTARLERLRTEVERLTEEMLPLRKPDLLLMKPEQTSLTTPRWKAHEIRRLAQEYPCVTRILFWDDRKDNLRAVATSAREIARLGGAEILVFDSLNRRSRKP